MDRGRIATLEPIGVIDRQAFAERYRQIVTASG
jgi:hypothetical protein